MVIKKYLKVGIIVFFILLTLVSGIIMLRKLTHDKQVFEEDLYSYIPAITSSLFQINKAKDVELFSKYFPEIESVLLSVSPSVTYPILIASASNNSFLVTKVTAEQEQSIEKILSKDIFPAFPPKTRMYKDTKIFFYPSSDNRFFACMFYHGIFVGGYSYDFLEAVIDADDNDKLFIDDSVKSLQKGLKANYSANLIFKEGGRSFIFNGGFNHQGMLEFTGCSDSELRKDICTNLVSDTLSIDYAILPKTLLSYTIGLTRCKISKDFMPYCDDLFYEVEIDTLQKSHIFLLKTKKDRFEIFEKLNTLEVSYIGGRLSTKDVVLKKQHVYTLSEQLSDSLFKEKSSMTLSFYKGYLVYSKDREALVRYLRIRESLTENQIQTSEVDKRIFKSMFRANNIKESKMIPFNSYLSVFYESFSSVNLNMNYLDSGQIKTEIILNN